MVYGRLWILIGSACGFLGVAAGAFGAHALRSRISPENLQTFEVAVRYHLIHAVCLLAVGALQGLIEDAKAPGWRTLRLAGWAFTIGILLFSGSLYALALGGWNALGAITPFGGLAFLAGWALLAWSALRSQPPPPG
jgi:uncharacterized membrane protein YgdD (TMEM256/DUF423 family)